MPTSNIVYTTVLCTLLLEVYILVLLASSICNDGSSLVQCVYIAQYMLL